MSASDAASRAERMRADLIAGNVAPEHREAANKILLAATNRLVSLRDAEQPAPLSLDQLKEPRIRQARQKLEDERTLNPDSVHLERMQKHLDYLEGGSDDAA